MRYQSPLRRSYREHTTSPKNRGRFQHISATVAVLSAVISVISVSINIGSFRRDRAKVQVAVRAHEQMPRAFVEGLYSNVQFFGRSETDDEARDWYVMTIVNNGRRPVHIEKVRLRYVRPSHGLGESVMFVPWDQTLTEEKRSASFAFERSPTPSRIFRSAHVIDDSGTAYAVDPQSITLASPWQEP